ncbi:MAG: hypothetical protein AB7P76_08355 [Candidatus Melainabacteria bacterium]
METSSVIDVIIEERSLDRIDPGSLSQAAALQQAARFGNPATAPGQFNSTGNVFKHYLMEAEPYYIDADL